VERSRAAAVSAGAARRLTGIPLGTAYTELAREAPDRVAVTFDDIKVTRAELERRTNRLARMYQQLGVTRDSLVTIALPNGIEFIEAMLATWKAGATPQPISAALPARERDTLLELARPSLVVGLDESITGCATVPPGLSPDAAVSDAPLDGAAAASWKAPTSGGSTGRPKLVVATRPATTDAITHTAEAFRILPHDTLLTTGPLYHNGVFITTASAVMLGCHVVIMHKFDPARALELVEQERVTWFYAVPTMMQRIMRLPPHTLAGADPSSLRVVYHLAAPCPAWLKRAWIDWVGADAVWEMYGGTEAQAATVISGREWLEHEGSVGRAVFGEITIRGGDGEPVLVGEVGEVWMRSNDPDQPTYRYVGSTAKERDGWESLGDLGWMDADGYLYLTGRETDMILIGGANVYPAEVEAALDEHPAVGSSCVIGLPHEDLGNRLHAIVQLRDDVDDAELSAFLAERLARHKLPRSFERVEFPLRDDAGKVRRSALRDARAAGPSTL
jgi:bile acid-coenzyme A ligase